MDISSYIGASRYCLRAKVAPRQLGIIIFDTDRDTFLSSSNQRILPIAGDLLGIAIDAIEI